ncbi:hypothetical protein HER32_14310 [Hymenobacter sp. BT18]|uniref:hypothetical protein n=1 Tax=Hymenobacter sp. BT18 TaxID=2835648 RepID=UPI00143E0FC8|nr:hypothetical protein [Hymenobacter sp. BT18]QIX62287.1 hypothetical protein HER32_14310 [Hymenobacter sp. BT18]
MSIDKDFEDSTDYGTDFLPSDYDGPYSDERDDEPDFNDPVYHYNWRARHALEMAAEGVWDDDLEDIVHGGKTTPFHADFEDEFVLRVGLNTRAFRLAYLEHVTRHSLIEYTADYMYLIGLLQDAQLNPSSSAIPGSLKHAEDWLRAKMTTAADVVRRRVAGLVVGKHDILPVPDVNEFGSTISGPESHLPKQAPSELRASAKTPPAGRATPKTFYDLLSSGFTRQRLDNLLGKEGLNLFDFDARTRTATQKPSNWITLYWALVNEGYIVSDVAGSTAAKLIKSTFPGTKISTSRINSGRLNETPSRSVNPYYHRVLSRL